MPGCDTFTVYGVIKGQLLCIYVEDVCQFSFEKLQLKGQRNKKGGLLTAPEAIQLNGIVS